MYAKPRCVRGRLRYKQLTFDLSDTATAEDLRERLRTVPGPYISENTPRGKLVLAGIGEDKDADARRAVEDHEILQELLNRPDVQELVQRESLPPDVLLLKLVRASGTYSPYSASSSGNTPYYAITAEELGFDPIDGVKTPGAYCKDRCGFYGSKSGHCSQCWSQKSLRERIRLSDLIKDKAAEYEKAQQELIARNYQKIKEQEEREKQAELELEKREQALKERKTKQGLCYFCRPLSGGSDLEDPFEPREHWNLWTENNQKNHDYEIWTCGVRPAGSSPQYDHNDENHKDDWQSMHSLVVQLTHLVSAAKERTEANNHFQATYFHRDFLQERGVSDDMSPDQALRKALEIDVNFEEVVPLPRNASSYWSPMYADPFDEGRKNHSVDEKLKQATQLIQSHCSEPAYWFRFPGEKCEPTYPTGFVARTKENGHLLFIFAERVET
jgi:hypothetical protein